MADYYTAASDPADDSDLDSSIIRAEWTALAAGFAKIAGYTGNGSKVIAINSGGTAMEALTTTGTGNGVRATSPTLVTPVLGVATATSINKITLTQPATGATLTLTDGKTLAATHTLTLSGTDGTTMTFPSTSATIARTDATNAFTGAQSITGTLTGAVGAGSSWLIRLNTTDGADSSFLTINAGGASSVNRGGSLMLAGNEHSTIPGYAYLSAGNVVGGVAQLRTGNDIVGLQVSRSADGSTAGDTTVYGVLAANGGSLTTDDVTFTAFAGATTLLTIGGTGATSVVAIPGTKESTASNVGAVTIAGGLGVAKALWAGGTIKSTTSAGFQVAPLTGTDSGYYGVSTTGGTLYIGLDSSAAAVFGTAGNYGTVIYRPASTGFAISRASTVDLSISATGAVTIPGTLALTATATPTGTGAGVVGQIAWDTSYLYICTATNDWRRVAITDF